jgi:molybdenum cofactor cytidylyltransferase
MTNKPRNHFAIIPAAGHSRRMGQSKLLLPWGDATIIDRVLQAWTTSRVTKVVVVMRRDDVDLWQACERWPVSVITPQRDPEDMKESIQVGLKHLAEVVSPNREDRCFVAPADLPTLTAEIIDALIATETANESIIVPRFGQRSGHPALLPWSLTGKIFELAENEGVNRIVDQNDKTHVLFSAEKLVTDVDTPEQYQQLLRKTGTK